MSAVGTRIRIQPEQAQAVRRVAEKAGISESRAVALMIAVADAELADVGGRYTIMAGGVLRVAEAGNQGQAATSKPADKEPKVIRATKARTTPNQRKAATTKPSDQTPKNLRATNQQGGANKRQAATTKSADNTRSPIASVEQDRKAEPLANNAGTDEWADLNDEQRELLRHEAFILNEDREVVLRESAPDGMSQHDWNMLSNTYLPGDDGSMFFSFTWASQQKS